jgi:hypothetical protein
MSNKKKKETKSEKFNRLASMRVTKILKYLDLLENCSNSYTYDYDDEDVAKIFKAINSKLKQAKLSFEKKSSNKSFEL